MAVSRVRRNSVQRKIMKNMKEFDVVFYRQAADYIHKIIKEIPDVAVVLGSAMGPFTDKIRNAIEIDYADIPNFPVSTVAFHAGKLVFGTLAGKKILCMSGRFHAYEGYNPVLLSMPVRVFRLLGVKQTILTNAAGAVNLSYAPGDVMIISDHIKLSSQSPMIGPNIAEFGERFFDVSDMYTASLRKIAMDCAKNSPLRFHEGVYMYFAGPQFETPAEIRMARILGADAVGMSTVPEALTAAHCGMPVLGFSVITNMAAGIVKEATLSHEEVASTMAVVNERFSDYLKEVIGSI